MPPSRCDYRRACSCGGLLPPGLLFQRLQPSPLRKMTRKRVEFARNGWLVRCVRRLSGDKLPARQPEPVEGYARIRHQVRPLVSRWIKRKLSKSLTACKVLDGTWGSFYLEVRLVHGDMTCAAAPRNDVLVKSVAVAVGPIGCCNVVSRIEDSTVGIPTRQELLEDHCQVGSSIDVRCY